MKAKKIIGLILALVMCLGIMTPMTAFADAAAASSNVLYFEDFENYTATYGDIARKGSTSAIGAAHGWFSDKDTDKNGVYDMAVGKALDGSDNMALNYSNGNDTLQFDFRLTSAEHGLVKDLAKDFVVSFKLYPVDIGTFQFTFKDEGTGNPSASTTDFTTSNGAIKMGGNATAFKIPVKQWSTIEITFHYDETAGGVNQISAKLNGEDVYYEKDGERVYTAKTASVHPNIDFWRISVTKGKYISIDDWKVSYPVEEAPAATAKTEFVGYQATAAANNKFNLRLVGIMNDEDYSAYEKVGFKVNAVYNNGASEKSTTQDIYDVYQSIVAENGDNYTQYTAEQLGGEYIFVLNCKNIPTNMGSITFQVTTYYKLADSDVVEEETVTFTVDPATGIPQPEVK